MNESWGDTFRRLRWPLAFQLSFLAGAILDQIIGGPLGIGLALDGALIAVGIVTVVRSRRR